MDLEYSPARHNGVWVDAELDLGGRSIYGMAMKLEPLAMSIKSATFVGSVGLRRTDEVELATFSCLLEDQREFRLHSESEFLARRSHETACD